MHLRRIFSCAVVLLAFIAVGSLSMNTEAQTEAKPQAAVASSEHDFDFLVGSWNVQHRKLKSRLVHSTEWETFSGTCDARLMLDGQADVDDNVLDTPRGTYRAMTLRAF